MNHVIEKMYYNGKEIVADAPSPDGRTCDGCIFDGVRCTAPKTLTCSWYYKDNVGGIVDKDVIFKYAQDERITEEL